MAQRHGARSQKANERVRMVRIFGNLKVGPMLGCERKTLALYRR
jgi:hypothetical protein